MPQYKIGIDIQCCLLIDVVPVILRQYPVNIILAHICQNYVSIRPSHLTLNRKVDSDRHKLQCMVGIF